MLNDNDIDLPDEYKERIDPDPLTILLEIANLVFQPGALAGMLASSAAAAQILSYKQMKDKQKSEIRRRLFIIDRALIDGASSLESLSSFLEQFNYLERPLRIGGAPISGYKNAQKLRRIHEDCRSAVKEARDAFVDLSALLPTDDHKKVEEAIYNLNVLSGQILKMGNPYGVFVLASAYAFSEIDNLICGIGEKYDFKRRRRSFVDDLLKSLPTLENYKSNIKTSNNCMYSNNK